MPHRVGGPLPLSARQGREQQKYNEDGARLVAGTIPYKHLPDHDTTSNNGPDGIRVLMITSRGGKGYVFPKGGWETDESVESAAQRETVEEAGVRGELETPMLGCFAFQSGKAERLQSAQKGRCIAHMFCMKVSEELEKWPESSQRQRVWFTIEEAYQKARYDWMKEALRVWITRHGWMSVLDSCTILTLSQSNELAVNAFAAADDVHVDHTSTVALTKHHRAGSQPLSSSSTATVIATQPDTPGVTVEI